MMYIKWVFVVTLWLTAVALGPIGYFLARKYSWAEKIWGNDIDSMDGDAAYQNNEGKFWLRRPWPSFWWSVVRNPANNFSRLLGPKGTISNIEKRGHLTIAVVDGKKYWLFYTPDWLFMFKIGYKLWGDHRIGSYFEQGKWMSNGLALSIQRGGK